MDQHSNQPGRPPRRRATQQARHAAAGKVACQLKLDAQTVSWLDVHALADGCTRSQLVERIISQQPTRAVLSRRGGAPALAVGTFPPAELAG